MGRTARFEQIYVASLEAEPVENETLTGVNSILTREIEANEIKLVDVEGIKGRIAFSNNLPTKQVSLGNKLFIDKNDEIVFDLKAAGSADRMFINNQLSIGTTNPVNAFQVDSGGQTKVNIDISGKDLMTINGNLVATNVIVSDQLSFSSNLVIDGVASNIVSINGSMKTSNLSVGSNVIITEIGLGGGGSDIHPNNVAVFTGNVTVDGGMYIYGNTVIQGNLFIKEQATYERVVNLIVADTTIVFGQGNDGTMEPMLIYTHDEDDSNIGFGFKNDERAVPGFEMALFRTTGGPLDSTFSVDDTISTNLHVFGDIYTSNAVGVANIFPTHDLCVGSNLFVEDTGSNVLEVFGNTFTENIKIGSNVTVGNDIVVIDPTNKDVAIISGNVKVDGLRTTGTKTSGISNVVPTDTLSIGSRVYVNLTASNTLTIFGNTMTTNLITQSISSSSNITVHADRYGGDSPVNPLILKSGPSSSNVSSIEIYGASTSNTYQNIRFKTRNDEKMRITSNGQVGINTTNPTQKLTVNGNAFVMGSNVMMFGNLWGTTSNTSMQMFSSPNIGENEIQNIVETGKGLNFYASTTPTMGVPKLTVLESSNVGINTQNPLSTLHVNGLTSFINNPVTKINGYNHLGIPLVVSNNQPITGTTDLASVLHLAREGSGSEHAARAQFQLGKHENAAGTSKSRLDIVMGDADYAVDTSIMTILSSGKVGIGVTQPAAHFEVDCVGIADPIENGILVHNTTSGDAIMAAQTNLDDGNAFTSYIQTDGVVLSGWSTGVTGDDGDYRITNHHERLIRDVPVGIYISGSTGDVGIGTDAPRGALEVSGNLVIGNELSFGGVPGQLFGNTRIIERRYTADQPRSELLLFKGNDGDGGDTAPDRIRHIAAEHVFQTYNSSEKDFYDGGGILAAADTKGNFPLCITAQQDPGIVVIGGNGDTAANRGQGTKLVVNGDIEFDSGGSFKLTGLEFSTSDLGYNIIRNTKDGAARRALTFAHERTSIFDDEFARFDEDGRFGLGITSPTSNIHVYDTTPGDHDIMKLQSTGDDKNTNIVLYTNNDEGGIITGFSNVDNATTGLALSVANVQTGGVTTCLNIVNTSNVGVGTPTPARQFHVVDHRNPLLGQTGTMRVESISSNASIEFTTSGGSSNIYADTTGNVYIQPATSHTTVDSNLHVTGDLSVGGNIDFSQIAVNLPGGREAVTAIEVAGGSVIGSGPNETQRKTYSHTFSVSSGSPKDVQLMFGAGAFYAKITTMLRRTDAAALGDPVGGTVDDISTMVLDLIGGTSPDQSSGESPTPSSNVTIGNLTLFGGNDNAFPWSPVIGTGKVGVTMTPYNVNNNRAYSYDYYVELTTACGGKLEKITTNHFDVNGLDNGNGGQTEITTFDY
jgi:hypothetical protein